MNYVKDYMNAKVVLLVIKERLLFFDTEIFR